MENLQIVTKLSVSNKFKKWKLYKAAMLIFSFYTSYMYYIQYILHFRFFSIVLRLCMVSVLNFNNIFLHCLKYKNSVTIIDAIC